MKRAIRRPCHRRADNNGERARRHPDVFFERRRSIQAVRHDPDAAGDPRRRDDRGAQRVPDVTGADRVPMRLTGPGSKLPPHAGSAERSAVDPQFFTASLWLMERGSLQVRIAVDGGRGPASLSVPVAGVRADDARHAHRSRRAAVRPDGAARRRVHLDHRRRVARGHARAGSEPRSRGRAGVAIVSGAVVA